jgi:hypothetical protein
MRNGDWADGSLRSTQAKTLVRPHAGGMDRSITGVELTKVKYTHSEDTLRKPTKSTKLYNK